MLDYLHIYFFKDDVEYPKASTSKEAMNSEEKVDDYSKTASDKMLQVIFLTSSHVESNTVYFNFVDKDTVDQLPKENVSQMTPNNQEKVTYFVQV